MQFQNTYGPAARCLPVPPSANASMASHVRRYLLDLSAHRASDNLADIQCREQKHSLGKILFISTSQAASVKLFVVVRMDRQIRISAVGRQQLVFMITVVIDLFVKVLPDNIVSSRRASGASFRFDRLKLLLVILRMLNCSSSASLKKLSISLCSPLFPIPNILIVK